MLVGISGQLLDAGQDLRQNGINLVVLAKIITELWKRKRRDRGERKEEGCGGKRGGMEEGRREG